MKKYSTLALLTLVIMAPFYAQEYSYHSDAPFGIQTTLPDSTRKAQSISFWDYDGDGDLDVFLSGLDYVDNVNEFKWINIHFFIQMQENIGDLKHPQFGPRQDVFQQFPYPVGYFFATGADLNGDNLMDFITSAHIDYIGNQKLRMLINTGLQGAGQFQITTMDAFGLDDYPAQSLYVPCFTDLDGDGDLDLMTSGVSSAFAEENGPDVPTFKYARNAGDIHTPQFEGWYQNPYDLIPNPNGEILTAGDIDNDGDQDLLGSLFDIPSDSLTYLYLHVQSTGTDGHPTFGTALASPYGMPSATGENVLLLPTLTDIDGDGDLDLFVFSGSAQNQVLQYYENNLCQPTTQNVKESICAGGSIVFNGIEYSEAGDYTITLENSQHCDSIINLTLEVLPATTVEIEATICSGDVYEIGNESYGEPGEYLVTFTASNGCDSIVDLTLSLFPIETVSVDAMICDGDSYFVGNESFSDPGNYMIHLVTSNGCDSIVLLALEVDYVDPSASQNGNILIAAQSGATYQWFDCDAGQNIPGATNQTFEVSVTGNYQVYVTDTFGCTVQSMCLPVIISAVDHLLEHAIALYPNPASNVLHLINETTFPIGKCLLFDLTGHVVATYAYDGKNAFDVSALSPGMYLWSTFINGKTVMKKVVIVD